VKCDLEKLSAFLDGEAEELRSHVESCESCRRELAALSAMKSQLASLPAPEGEDRWLALANKLPEKRRPWIGGSWRRWALAPAFAAAALAAVVWVQRRKGPSDDVLLTQAEAEFRGAEAQYQRALAKLDQVVAHAEWPESRRREFASAKAALEAATAECQKVARAQRADAEAEELLFASYRKQIHFYEEQLLK
jgi:hypothetical protein